MCSTSLHNIQQDLINFIPVLSSLLIDAVDFLLAFETICTEFPHVLFPHERDLYIHESNGNVRTYENKHIPHPDPHTPVTGLLSRIHMHSFIDLTFSRCAM